MPQEVNLTEEIENWPKEKLSQFLRHLPQIADVMQERVRQDRKFGPQDRPPFDWFLILSEEVGEVAKECVELRFSDEAHPHGNLAKYRKELVETAAVALAALLNFDMRATRLKEDTGEVWQDLGGKKNEKLAETLNGGLLRQIERVTEIEKQYRALGKEGELAVAFMAADLRKARVVMNSGDITDMVAMFKELQGYTL